MNYNPSGKVENTPLLQDTATPNHVDKRKIDKDEPSSQKQHIRFERHPVREGTRDKSGRNDRKHHLIGDEDDERDTVINRRGRQEIDTAQERLVEIAYNSSDVSAETE